MHSTDKPTAAQIEMCVDLMNKLQFDLDWYNLDKLTRGQMARLIDKLQDALKKAKEERKYIGKLLDEMEG